MGWIFLVVIAVALLWWLGGLAVVAFEGYRAVRYDRHGICPKCKQPFDEQTVKPADQMYGPDRITQMRCSRDGTVSIASGNRRFAEW